MLALRTLSIVGLLGSLALGIHAKDNGFAPDEPKVKKNVDEAECAKETTDISTLAKVSLTAAEKLKECPNNENLTSLCYAITSRKEEPKDSIYLYRYEKIIFEAACADYENDSDDVKAKKVQVLWNKFEKELICDGSDFDIPNGNVLKYAARKANTDFMNDAVVNWKVNLNKVDASDKLTVLDYVQEQIDRCNGCNFEKEYKHYFKILRANGAKFKKEL